MSTPDEERRPGRPRERPGDRPDEGPTDPLSDIPGPASSHAFASGRDMYVAEQGDVHLHIDYTETADGREHHTVGPVTDDCPYPGLSAFTADQADRFFGRRRLLTELGERLADCHAGRTPLVVVAPSGAGKTSLLQAGLWQDLDQARVPVPGSRHWPRLLLTPTARPLAELTARLARLADEEPDRMAHWWTADRTRFARRLREAVPARTLVVVDQAEELFTLCADPAERQGFTELLAWLADPGAGSGDAPLAVVVLALRADFYARCAELPWLRTAVQNGQLLLPALTRAELADAIRRPARAAGLRLEPGLVELLLADFSATEPAAGPEGRGAGSGGDRSGDHPETGALPLLAHALRATWQNRQGRLLTVDGYTGTGGVAHAVGNTAERVFDRLDAAERRIARRLFLGLVTVGEDTADSRRRVRREQLLDAIPDRARAEAVLAAFTTKRLLVQDRDTVAITHEALLTAWPRLRGWIDDDRPRNLILQDLDAAARAWAAAGHEHDALYRGAPLARALDAAPPPDDPDEDDPLRRAFLDTSVRRAKRAVRIRHRLTAVLVVLVVVAAAASFAALRQSGSARAEQRQALAARIVSQAAGVRATDPALAAQLDLVAHRLAPRPETTLNVLADGNSILPRTRAAHRQNMVHETVYRPDGRVLASTGEDGKLRLWDASDPARLRPLGAPVADSALSTNMVFSPNGRLLASGRSFNTPARLWDVTDPAKPVVLPLPSAVATSYVVAFGPDGRTLAGVGPDRRMVLVDLGTPAAGPDGPARPAPPRRLAGAYGFPESLRFGADGRTLTGAWRNGPVRVWDLAHPDRAPVEPVPPLPSASGYRIAYSPDGRTLAMGNDARVWLWDLADPARPVRLRFYLPAAGDVLSLAFSADGQTLAVSDRGRTVRLWNVTDPAQSPAGTAVPAPPSNVRGLAFSPDGRTLVGGTQAGQLQLWSLPGRVLPAAAYGALSLAFAPDGRTLATGGSDGTVRLWNLASPAGAPRPLGTLNTGTTKQVTVLGFGRDGRTLATGGDGPLVLWDLADPARPRELSRTPGASQGSGDDARLSGDGRTLVFEDGATVRVWGLTPPDRPAATGSLPGKEDGIEGLTVSADGRMIGVGRHGGSAELWDRAASHRTATLPGPSKQDKLQALALSGDGRTLARADQDGELTLWDLADPARPVARGSSDPRGTTTALAATARGDLVAVGSGEGGIRFTGADRASFLSRAIAGSAQKMVALAFAPDGRTLASTAEDQPVRIWTTDPEAAARTVCAATGNVLTPALWAQYVPGQDYDPPCRDAP